MIRAGAWQRERKESTAIDFERQTCSVCDAMATAVTEPAPGLELPHVVGAMSPAA